MTTAVSPPEERGAPSLQLIPVDAYEFRRLVISNRRLVRADLPERQLKGLRDIATGECFVTAEKDLFR